MRPHKTITISIKGYGVEHIAVTDDTLENITDKAITLLEHVGYPRQEVYQAIENEIKNRL